jgi:two-component system, NarL family, response regulator NreC
MTTRILLTDDHAILRAGLRLLIDNQPDLEVVGEAGNGQEALDKAKALRPDLILLDLSMPEVDGLTVLPSLIAALPQTRVLILTMHDDVTHLRQALEAGAAGYVLKRAVDQELLIAIRAVMRGDTYVHSAMTQKLLEAVNQPQSQADSDPWSALSEREFAVMRLVSLGYTNAEIAEDLFLSVKTVETYRSRGMEKLDVQTRAQLVHSALQFGHLD